MHKNVFELSQSINNGWYAWPDQFQDKQGFTKELETKLITLQMNNIKEFSLHTYGRSSSLVASCFGSSKS